MKTFFFKAIDKDGKVSEGEKMALDKSSVAIELKKSGLSVISIDEKMKVKWWNNITIFSGGVKEQELIVFAKNLGKMIGAGLPVVRSIEIMEKQAKKGKFKEVLTNIREEVNKGTTLSDAMKLHPDVFSTLFVSMLNAGEESGNLSESLEIVGNQLEKAYLLKKKIKGAMMYPAIILLAMVIITILMLIFIVPTLQATFEGLTIELPLSTRFIIGTSNFVRDSALLLLLSVLAIVAGVVMFFRTKNGKRTLDFVLLKTPIVGDITKKINTARTARTLSSLLKSGVEYTTAVGITENVIQNSYYKAVLNDAGDAIVKGGNISEIFASNQKLYPLFISEMTSVGEETGKLAEMLYEVAHFYEEEVDQRTKDMSTVIEPFLMIIIGTGVGFFALSMMSPMYSLADKI